MTGAPGPRPLNPADPDVRKLALIELARQRGMPWTAIATALGAKDKAHAKKIRAELQKRVNANQHRLGEDRDEAQRVH